MRQKRLNLAQPLLLAPAPVPATPTGAVTKTSSNFTVTFKEDGGTHNKPHREGQHPTSFVATHVSTEGEYGSHMPSPRDEPNVDRGEETTEDQTERGRATDPHPQHHGRTAKE